MIFSAKKVSPVVHSSSPYQQSSPCSDYRQPVHAANFPIKFVLWYHYVQLKSHRQFVDSYTMLQEIPPGSSSTLIQCCKKSHRQFIDSYNAACPGSCLILQVSKVTICCKLLVSHPPPACFFGTRFAGRYCIFYRSRTQYASMLLFTC